MLRRLDYKCHFCASCEGMGCVGEMPGMGGAFNSANFIENVAGWKKVAAQILHCQSLLPAQKQALLKQFQEEGVTLPTIRLAPMTGAVENVGYQDERSFYFDLIIASCAAGIELALGDGCPDEKLLFGIEAVKAASQFFPQAKSAVFIKPYENKRILERMEWSKDVAEIYGVDIDSYNIITMRNKVNLEKKTAATLKELQSASHLPFAIKGVFTKEDVEMVTELKPDIVVVSNHGGRIETRKGSTAEFLQEYGNILKSNCKELWVDSGIRNFMDLMVAAKLGATQVMIGRPIVTALCRDGVKGVIHAMDRLQTPPVN